MNKNMYTSHTNTYGYESDHPDSLLFSKQYIVQLTQTELLSFHVNQLLNFSALPGAISESSNCMKNISGNGLSVKFSVFSGLKIKSWRIHVSHFLLSSTDRKTST